MGFEPLQISEPLKKALSSSVNSGRFPHAAILEDEDSERLMDTAKTLAAALVCSGDDKPCGRCINCLKARSDSHPDIKIFEPDPKTNNFKVETVREIRSDAYIVANEADRKVYILKDAQNMLVPAQNALLKVLEEPPEGVCFLLLTDDKNVFCRPFCPAAQSFLRAAAGAWTVAFLKRRALLRRLCRRLMNILCSRLQRHLKRIKRCSEQSCRFCPNFSARRC